MSYELAKKLKEAGFSQKERLSEIKTVNFINGERVEDTYFPTLSELIEECGDRFRSLVNEREFWYAISESIEKDFCKGDGKTPEEAVAKLWLELNKK